MTKKEMMVSVKALIRSSLLILLFVSLIYKSAFTTLTIIFFFNTIKYTGVTLAPAGRLEALRGRGDSHYH